MENKLTSQSWRIWGGGGGGGGVGGRGGGGGRLEVVWVRVSSEFEMVYERRLL